MESAKQEAVKRPRTAKRRRRNRLKVKGAMLTKIISSMIFISSSSHANQRRLQRFPIADNRRQRPLVNKKLLTQIFRQGASLIAADRKLSGKSSEIIDGMFASWESASG